MENLQSRLRIGTHSSRLMGNMPIQMPSTTWYIHLTRVTDKYIRMCGIIMYSWPKEENYSELTSRCERQAAARPETMLPEGRYGGCSALTPCCFGAFALAVDVESRNTSGSWEGS